ncbi:hypothetical protein M427DRAFT_57107 [Gonapodya prolifera JEL478]|uniref:Uncharacterized protein n=1 Tax=Gonapodya prolifera (strain JEL478) TaxID=1344416 RepID=A0A139ADR6_GONPJ|nr:hypothetical protein M427DRAFT_57107 [Gonapodya prolifera JEL478]|eukprot:KXS14962.1 hypothetical protein M427DRAFT_57107 [Gonapodya prolifera JEL478]
MDTASVLSGSDGLPVSEERPLSPTAPPSISSLASLARRPIMPTAASPPPPVPVPTSPRGPQPTQDYFVPMKGVDDDSGGGGGVKRNASMKAEVESLAPTVLFRNMPAVTVHAGTNGTGRSFPAAAVKVNVNVAPGQAAAFVPWGN